MKNLLSKLLLFSVLGFFAMSCSEDEEILTDPTDEFDVELAFAEGNGDVTESVSVTPTDGTIKARVQISSSSNMRRVYITRSVGGAGFEPYTPADLTSAATKPDGSLDVETDPNDIDYTLNLDVPSGISEGTVVYRFWATSGRGDYRDADKRYVAGIGEIQLLYGGSNPAAPLITYSAKMLAAPLADGSSETFLSLLDGQVYRIDQGEEYVAFWDFGYYYGASGLASLSSTFDYPSAIVDVPTISGVPESELNECFFRLSTNFDAAGFSGASVSGDLNGITTPTNQTINQLSEGDVVEFVDNYGKKGLIEVVTIQGTFNSTDFIEINVKVQP